MKRNRVSLGLFTGFALIALVFVLVASSGLFAGPSASATDEQPILDIPTTPTPTVPVPPTDAPTTASTQLLSDDFSSEGTLSRWESVEQANFPEEQASWLVKDGQLEQNGLADGVVKDITPVMFVAGDPGWTDYTVSTKVFDLNNATFGLVARRQGDSYYRFRINADQFPDTPKLVLEKVVNGEATALVSSDGPGYQQREWHTVAMTLRGDAIAVTLDGTVVAEATDATLASGQAGVYTRALGNIVFDSFAVTSR